MIPFEGKAGESRNPALEGELETEMVQALRHFKASVDAWSDASYSRPRIVVSQARHSWRLAASWALGCVLAAGSLAGVAIEQQHRHNLARIAAVKAAAQKTARERAAAGLPIAPVTPATESQPTTAATKPATNNANSGDENLLAAVDSSVSQQVPAAMEPLAQLMDDNGAQ